MKPDSICRHLRTKKMYIPAQEEEVFTSAGAPEDCSHYWCNRTLTEIGSDDQLVSVQGCNPTRSCFER